MEFSILTQTFQCSFLPGSSEAIYLLQSLLHAHQDAFARAELSVRAVVETLITFLLQLPLAQQANVLALLVTTGTSTRHASHAPRASIAEHATSISTASLSALHATVPSIANSTTWESVFVSRVIKNQHQPDPIALGFQTHDH